MPLRKNITITANAARPVAALLLALATQGCAQPPAMKDTRAADEATIRAYSQAASEAAHAKDVDKEISFYADDALGFSNYGPTTTTKEAMLAEMKHEFSDPGTIRWKTSTIEVARSGDLAYEHGRYTYTTPEKDGKTKIQTGNYLLVWRKPPGGDWKIAVDTDSEDPPAASPSAK
jgi:ketosteroid isomerase-like protein